MIMTWGEFKKAVEELGAKDEHIVDFIDVCDPVTKDGIYVSINERDGIGTVVSMLGDSILY